jgi:hypothetical protein
MKMGGSALCHPSSRFITYSLPTIEIDIKNQELALQRFAPQRLIFHWEGSSIQAPKLAAIVVMFWKIWI